MSKKVLERMGMEAKSVVENGNIPCTFIVAGPSFGNWSYMGKLAKKLKGEFKVHDSSMFLQMTNDITKFGQQFTTGCSSFSYNNITIGICSTLFGHDMKPTTVVAIPFDHKYEYIKLKKLLDELIIKLPRFKKNKAWTIGSAGNGYVSLKIDIKDIINEQNKDIINSIESFYNNPSPYTEIGLPPFRKICFAGKPGTGKTVTAQAIAKHLMNKYKIPTVYIGGSSAYGCDFDFIKVGISSLMKLKRPSLLIVEEFDSFCSNPTNRSKILNFLDGFETPNLKYPLCLIMTTNHPENIDPAIIDRSGRVNRVFWFNGIKTLNEAQRIVDVYKGKLELPDISDLLIGKTPDFTKELLMELKWKKANNESIDKPTIAEVIKKLGSGTVKEDNVEGYL